MPQVDWNQQEYDAAKPGQRFPVLPAGRYLCLILDIQKKPTKNGQGQYFEAMFDVAAPKQYAGTRLWARMNVYNPSETAQRIGREQFKALGMAAGIPDPDKTERLHNKKVVCVVGIREYNGSDQNEVLGFEAPQGAAAGAAQARPAATSKSAEPAQQPAPRQTAAATMEDDDDIPF